MATTDTIDMKQNADGTYEADAKTAGQSNQEQPPKEKTIKEYATEKIDWVRKNPLKALAVCVTTGALLYLGHTAYKAVKAAIATPSVEQTPVDLAATPLVNSIPDDLNKVEDTLLDLAEIGAETCEAQAAAADSVQAIKDAAESMGMTVEKIETL